MTMTYSSLFNQVLSYLDRTDIDTTNQVANFIFQAQQRIARDTKTLGLEVYATGLLTPGVAVYAKPANWRRNITFNVGTGSTNNARSPVLLRSYEFLINYWPNRTLTATPLYYCDYGYSNYLLAPTPDAAYPFEFSFLELPTPITPLNQTNWLTNFAPDVLLYATLLEATPYLKDDERLGMWEDQYKKRIDSLNGQDDQRVYDRQSNRSAD